MQFLQCFFASVIIWIDDYERNELFWRKYFEQCIGKMDVRHSAGGAFFLTDIE